MTKEFNPLCISPDPISEDHLQRPFKSVLRRIQSCPHVKSGPHGNECNLIAQQKEVSYENCPVIKKFGVGKVFAAIATQPDPHL